MSDAERLQSFKSAVEAASREYGVQIAIIGQVGNVVMHEPTLGYIVLPEITVPDAPPLSDDVRAALEMASVPPLPVEG